MRLVTHKENEEQEKVITRTKIDRNKKFTS